MPQTPRRSFLDRPITRVLGAVVFLGCLAGLVYLERERLWQAAADQREADDPFARCLAERAGDIDRMLAEKVIEEAQAELFKSRAEAMCRAAIAESRGEGPPLPAE
jgi:hypothetical protein